MQYSGSGGCTQHACSTHSVPGCAQHGVSVRASVRVGAVGGARADGPNARGVQQQQPTLTHLWQPHHTNTTGMLQGSTPPQPNKHMHQLYNATHWYTQRTRSKSFNERARTRRHTLAESRRLPTTTTTGEAEPAGQEGSNGTRKAWCGCNAAASTTTIVGARCSCCTRALTDRQQAKPTTASQAKPQTVACAVVNTPAVEQQPTWLSALAEVLHTWIASKARCDDHGVWAGG